VQGCVTEVVGQEHADKRDGICEDLEGSGIETRPFFYPVHGMPPYQHYKVPLSAARLSHPVALASPLTVGAVQMITGRPESESPVTDLVAASGFNIPTSAHLSYATQRCAVLAPCFCEARARPCNAAR
jgi:hypothetical protein